ncbi:siderophore ABC transporter substrate-binding protein [Salicibibacter cibi]|uniref:Siderophore ABC transporter substrate-binding protein n=1 Tax=Salicibibacter cibi TaxID=2743001 RepID=A0A7T6ZD18_9BACI|nr:siderophore ABC transporter substrate-binding protein [Salicibibacter cibi]QQK81278.1 siderophore ABC transporter substrate-binding protein [Salicibibacter cibi]
MGKPLIGILTGLSMTFALAACSGENNDEATGDEENQSSETEEITIEHDFGETEVPVNPETVVSFDNGLTDSIRELGGNISGIPKAGNVPEYLSEFESDEYEDVGDLFEPNFELINEMQPDVIFISGRASDNYEELSEIAPTVYMDIDDEDFMGSLEENVTTLGEIFDAEDEAENQLDEVQTRISEVSEQVNEADEDGLILSVDDGSASAYGAGSRFGLIHDVLDVTPADEAIDSETHGENVSFEYIADVDPDNLFVLDRGATVGSDEEASLNEILDNELVESTTAFQNDKIIQMTGDYWYLSYGGLESTNHMIDEVEEGIAGS